MCHEPILSYASVSRPPTLVLCEKTLCNAQQTAVHDVLALHPLTLGQNKYAHLRIYNGMQVGRLFQEVSNGQYAEKVLPYLLESAPFAGVDRVPFQQALQSAVRDKPQVRALQAYSVCSSCLLSMCITAYLGLVSCGSRFAKFTVQHDRCDSHVYCAARIVSVWCFQVRQHGGTGGGGAGSGACAGDGQGWTAVSASPAAWKAHGQAQVQSHFSHSHAKVRQQPSRSWPSGSPILVGLIKLSFRQHTASHSCV